MFNLTEESQGLGVSNLIYMSLQIDKFNRAIQENPHKDMKIIFNNNLVRSTLTAYKLFYVGCSRAEEELVVLIDENQIENMQEFKSCFKQIGFQINC
ncbi:hypothetical protein V9102_05205 [Streptococcus anginosus]|uniref:hypothetical protein n=1 Tax=Streptococcus anginosus TaxID=1328 RepID=UPI00300FCFFB